MAGLGTLPKAIVALGVEQTVFIKPGLLKTVIYIGGQNKILFALHQLQEVMVNRLWGIQIPVDVDIPTPICPVFFQTVKGIEAAGIHIAETILLNEVPKIFFKAFSCISKAS